MKLGLAMNIERLPILYKPPFDCVNANATCPACKKGQGNHGVGGSIVDFAVRTEHEGKRYAVSLRVFGADYLPVTRQWWQERGLDADQRDHRPADLAIHREDPNGIIAECWILGDGRHCRPSTDGLFAAEALFNAHGDPSAGDVRDQPEALWVALEHCLVDAIFEATGGDS